MHFQFTYIRDPSFTVTNSSAIHPTPTLIRTGNKEKDALAELQNNLTKKISQSSSTERSVSFNSLHTSQLYFTGSIYSHRQYPRRTYIRVDYRSPPRVISFCTRFVDGWRVFTWTNVLVDGLAESAQIWACRNRTKVHATKFPPGILPNNNSHSREN